MSPSWTRRTGCRRDPIGRPSAWALAIRGDWARPRGRRSSTISRRSVRWPARRREEEEVRGYRDALRLIHERHAKLRVSEKAIRELHRLSRGKLGDAGKYRTGESEIIEVQPDGGRRVRFKAVDADKVRPSVAEML